jgi:DNA-binding NtrC family response regulator
MLRGLSAMHVLIVEDELLLRWALAETLTRAGCSVAQAGDAASALGALASAAEPVDAVLMDFRLPDSDDLGLLTSVRRMSPRSAVVMMTAHGAPEVVAGAYQLGVHTVLNKPFDVEGVPAILRTACDARRP